MSSEHRQFQFPGCAGAAPSSNGRTLESPGRPTPAGHLSGADIEIRTMLGRKGFGITDLENALAALDRPPVVVVRSGGGCIETAIALAKRLRAAEARLCAYSAASAAALLVVAGRHRRIAENGWIATHRSWTAVAGGSDELDAAARMCTEIDNQLGINLARWSSMTTEQAAKAIRDGYVWDARAALDAGLVDEIGPPVECIGQRPDALIEGPSRELHHLREASDAAGLRAEWERSRVEAQARRAGAPEINDIKAANASARVLEAATPPHRLAQIFSYAGGDAYQRALDPDRDRDPAFWVCERCLSFNFTPPAIGTKPTACTTCTSLEQ